MEYSKDAEKTRSFKFIVVAFIMCVSLIAIDIMLIYGFAHTLQNML